MADTCGSADVGGALSHSSSSTSASTSARDASSAQKHLVLAEQLFSASRIGEALRQYDAAERLGADPDEVAAKQWFCLMLLGRFEDAWRQTDRTEARRLARGDTTRELPRHFQRVWNGAPFAGKRVLVRCYHGLGDTLQFIRYIPLLRETAAHVTVQCQPSLATLLRSVTAIDSMIFLDDSRPEPPFDLDIELMELPYAFRTTLETIPAAAPYLSVPADMVRARRLSRDTFNVGLVWSSGTWNPERNARLREFEALSLIPTIRLFSLQRGPAEQELDACTDMGIAPAEPGGGALEDAAMINNLDLVISVDTMVAHLAGALGRSVWTVLPFSADWRWMLNRSDSPWYPTMRLFRQSRRGEWQPLIANVARELAALAAARK
jgi:hypothetical protein